MDDYTIRGLREEAAAAGRPPKLLVSLRPQDSLHAVIGKLFRNRCSMAPVLSAGDGGAHAPLGRSGGLSSVIRVQAGRAAGRHARWSSLVAAVCAARVARSPRVLPASPKQLRDLWAALACGQRRRAPGVPAASFKKARTQFVCRPPAAPLPACTSLRRRCAAAQGQACRQLQRRAPPRRQPGAAPPGAGLTGARARGAAGGGGEAATLLHIATISGALACLMRHFRASLASLPLLAQPISALPVGTWSPDSPHAAAEPAANGTPPGAERRDWRKARARPPPGPRAAPPTPPITAFGRTVLFAALSGVPAELLARRCASCCLGAQLSWRARRAGAAAAHGAAGHAADRGARPAAGGRRERAAGGGRRGRAAGHVRA